MEAFKQPPQSSISNNFKKNYVEKQEIDRQQDNKKSCKKLQLKT